MCCIVIHVIKIIRSCNFNPPPRLGGHEIHSFGIPSLTHYYYILSVSDLCPGVKKNIYIE